MRPFLYIYKKNKMEEYNINLFQDVSKERFIEQLNNKNGDLFIIGSILAFNFTKTNRIITDIINFNEEIALFNSFGIIKKYNNKKYIIVENFTKYIDHRAIKQITYQRRFLNSFNNFESDIFLLAFINRMNGHARSNELGPILIKTQQEPLKETFTKALEERFIHFDFQNIGFETSFEFEFEKFDGYYKNGKLKDKHLSEVNVFDEFILKITGKTRSFLVYKRYYDDDNDDDYKLFLLDDYIKLQTEFYDCIGVVADYLGYDLYILNVNRFKFKKK